MSNVFVSKPTADHQRLVDRYFQATAPFWQAIYQRGDIASAIYQERREVVLSMVAGLALARDSAVLEVGCGAGATAASLAERYLVEAVDTLQEMLDLTRARAIAGGVGHRLTTRLGDANNLLYPNHTFDLVLAIGVLPWLRDGSRAIAEFARVLRPGGYLIVTIDNAWALQRIVDPQLNPATQRIKQIAKTALSRAGVLNAEVRVQLSPRSNLHRMLKHLHLSRVSSKTLGFGPFTVFDHKMLPHAINLKLHHRLQKLADAGAPLLRDAGSHYIVLAKKPE